MDQKIGILATICLICLFGYAEGYSCTIFRLKAKDGSIMVGRSMEWSLDFKNDVIVVPRNKQFVSPFKSGITGMEWKTRHGYVGIANMGLDYGITGGTNEKGLTIGVLWYETDMQWQSVTTADSKVAVAQSVFSDWVMGSFATVNELKAAVKNVKVFNYVDPANGISPTCHWIVYDADGGCIVIEYDKGECNIYDNPLGIMTNAPSFPWHMANLRQYIGMNSERPAKVSGSGLTLRPTGLGTGMIGIPGDYSPPSRFVRLGMFTRFVDQQSNPKENLNLCNHIINTFTIPKGIITDTAPDGKTVTKEITQWVTFHDVTNRVLYFKTYENPTLRKIDLNLLDFSAKDIKRLPMYGDSESIIDLNLK